MRLKSKKGIKEKKQSKNHTNKRKKLRSYNEESVK